MDCVTTVTPSAKTIFQGHQIERKHLGSPKDAAVKTCSSHLLLLYTNKKISTDVLLHSEQEFFLPTATSSAARNLFQYVHKNFQVLPPCLRLPQLHPVFQTQPPLLFIHLSPHVLSPEQVHLLSGPALGKERVSRTCGREQRKAYPPANPPASQ